MNLKYILILITTILLFLSSSVTAQKYWVANSPGNWNNIANWSLTSGGPGGAPIPIATDNVIFDNNGIGNCNINTNATVVGLTVQAGYTGTISQNLSILNITTAILSGGVFIGGAAPIYANNFTISGTNFTSTNGTLTVCNSLIFSSGSFNHNSGTVKLSPTCGVGYTFTGNFIFYNLIYAVLYNNVSVNSPQTVLNNFTISSTTGGSGTLTLNSNINVNGNLNFVGTNGVSLSGSDTIKVKGNINMSNLTILGTGVVAMTGTIPQFYNGNTVRGSGTIPNLHIECNNVTFNNVVSFGYDFRYVSGTTNFSSSSIVYWNPLAGFTTTNSHIYGSMNFYKFYMYSSWDSLTINQPITVTDSTIINLPGAINLTLNSSLTANGHVLAIGTDEMILDGNYFNIRKNFIINNNTTTQTMWGTGTVHFDGTGNQLWDGTSALGQFHLPNIRIDKTSGILTLKEYSNIEGHWTYMQGLVDANTLGSTVEFDNNSGIRWANSVGMSFDNVVVNSSQWGPLNLETDMDVDHDFTITSVGGLVTNSNNMTVGDDWTNQNASANSFLPGNGTVTFDGNNPTEIQMIKSNGRTFYRLVINNTGLRPSNDEITLIDPLRISYDFNLISGRVLSSTANYVQLGNATTTNLGNAISYINGPMRYNMGFAGTRLLNFPLGKGSIHRPAIVNPTHSNATLVTYTGEMFNSSAAALGYTLPPTLTYVSYVRYWQIDRQVVANLTTCKVTLYYGPDDVVTDPTNLSVAKTIGTGTTWFDMGGFGSAVGTGYITSIPFSTFSRFTLANRIGGSNPLPIELVAFDAQPENDAVKVAWTTATEINNDYFTIEKSRDGVKYETVATVDGAGNSNNTLNYHHWDNDPYKGVSYYRLKQTDFDNSCKYYDPVSVNLGVPVEIKVQVFPNPFTESLNIIIQGISEEILLSITDMSGKMLHSTVISPDTDLYTTKIKSEIFPAEGIYLLELNYADKKYVSKLIFRSNR
jgi:hypothetical protein